MDGSPPIAHALARRSRLTGALDVSQLFRWTSETACALFVVVALLLVARRASGAFSAPASATTLATLGMTLIVVAFATALAIQGWPRRTRLGAIVGQGIAILLAAGAVSLADSPPAGFALLWLGTGAALAALAVAGTRPELLRGRRSESRQGTSPESPPTRHDSPRPRSTLLAETRRARVAGRETITGWLALEFVADQRVAVGHVAFCPAFADRPEVTAQAEGARVRVTHVLPTGARLEARLAEPAPTNLCLRVDFAASAAGV